MAKPPIEYFRLEASEILDRLVNGVSLLGSGSAQPGTVRELLRAAHTLKGAAHVVREAGIAQDSHAFETELSPHADAINVPAQTIAALLEITDRISAQLAALNKRAEPARPQTEAATEPAAIQALEIEPVTTMRVEAEEVNDLTRSLSEIATRAAELRSALATIEQTSSLLTALNLQVTRAAAPGGADQRTGTALAMIDEAQVELSHLEASSTNSLRRLDRELAHARELSARLHMAPAGDLFAVLERAVRNTADALGKTCRLQFRGGAQRLHASLLSAVRDALLHMARNAVVHGIESPEQRRLAGKAEQGTVVFDVILTGTQVTFRCSDDGRGIATESLRRTAVERGFVAADAARDLDDSELLQLVFEPGLTTETRAGQHAGRGIGLDVVKSTATRLGGTCRISSQPGQGTSVELSVPATMFGISALLVEAGGFQCALPVESVTETVHVTRVALQTAGGTRMAVVDGTAYRVIVMADVLRAHSIPAAKSDAQSILLLRGTDDKIALGVDRTLGIRELALTTFQPFVPVSDFVLGAAIDPFGTPQVVLDPIVMAKGDVQTLAPVDTAREHPSLPLLVIDDSLTTRMLEQSILESAGYQVDTAVSGDEALAKAHRTPYGLFLVDVEMPGMDGFSFIEATKADPKLKDTPSILVTSRSSAADRERGREVGASDYIVKSEFDQGRLLTRIAELARRQ